MAILRLFRIRNIVALAFVTLLAAAGYGFAAANTVGINGAGDGGATVSGYTTGGVTYSLGELNPANIDKVSFTLTPQNTAAGAPTSVKVKLISTGSTWYPCTVASSIWTCSGLATLASAADELRIVAVQ